MPKKHWHLLIFFCSCWVKIYFFLTYGNAGRLIPILFWVWIRLQNIFLGVPKSCGTHLKWVAGQDFFVQFWIMSFQQYFSHIFFFFQVLSAKLWHSPQVSCWARFFSQVLLAKLWHLPQVSCWPRFFSQVLSAKLWHSPQVSCWPRFFSQVLNHVHSTIFQS